MAPVNYQLFYKPNQKKQSLLFHSWKIFEQFIQWILYKIHSSNENRSYAYLKEKENENDQVSWNNLNLIITFKYGAREQKPAIRWNVKTTLTLTYKAVQRSRT